MSAPLNSIGLRIFFLSCQVSHAVVPRDRLGTGRRHHARFVPLVTTSDYRVKNVLGKEKIKQTKTLKNKWAVTPAVTEVLVAVSLSLSLSLSRSSPLSFSISISLSLCHTVLLSGHSTIDELTHKACRLGITGQPLV